MSGEWDYAIIQVGDDRRGERLNAALAIFTPDGIDIRLPRRLEKLRALSAALRFDDVRSALENLSDLDRFARHSGATSPAERMKIIGEVCPFKFSSSERFVAPTKRAYEEWVSKLLIFYVEPEPDLPRKVVRRTRLTTAIKKAFRQERVLARKGEDLAAHRVVANVTIADGLAADFVLKNGAMHVIETVDASSDIISLKKAVTEIAVSALVLEQARMTFGENATHSQLIYDASAAIEKLAAPSLEAAAHQGAELVNWSSHDDRRRLLAQIAMLAEPLPSKKDAALVGIHGGLQRRLDLN